MLPLSNILGGVIANNLTREMIACLKTHTHSHRETYVILPVGGRLLRRAVVLQRLPDVSVLLFTLMKRLSMVTWLDRPIRIM